MEKKKYDMGTKVVQGDEVQICISYYYRGQDNGATNPSRLVTVDVGAMNRLSEIYNLPSEWHVSDWASVAFAQFAKTDMPHAGCVYEVTGVYLNGHWVNHPSNIPDDKSRVDECDGFSRLVPSGSRD